MPLSTGKRRATQTVPISTSLPHMTTTSSDPPLKPAYAPGASVATEDSAMRAFFVNRRRRFILYTLTFATMLAMSSVLDVRRAALRNRHAKLQLSLPTASLSSLSDPSDSDSEATVPLTAATANNHNSSSNPSNRNSNNSNSNNHSNNDSHSNSNSNDNLPATQPPPVAADQLPPAPPEAQLPDSIGPVKHDYKLSQQELDDGVDQLIAHVDQEESAANSASANSTLSVENGENGAKDTNTDDPDSSAGNSEREATSSITSSSSSSSSSSAATPFSATNSVSKSDSNININMNGIPLSSNVASSNGTTSEDVQLNAEDTFHGAVQRLNSLLRNEKVKSLIDENDLRTLQALELQATRGDCELKSGASLFKTDAEAASNVDIERTHPLWGAWCLFMGSYKSDAMRDYVTKENAVEHKLYAAISELNSTETQTNGSSAISATSSSTIPADLTQKLEVSAPNGINLNSSNTNSVNTFDPEAASLDDVMTPEQQTALQHQAEMVVAHLQDNDLRYLAALSLQATFGDCGPYGRERLPDGSIIREGSSEERGELRKLREPLFEQTVTRKKGALWGAWCVMQGKRRTTAAANLAQRVELLVDQLTKSQEAAEAEENGETAAGASHSDSSMRINPVSRASSSSHENEEIEES